MRYQNSHKKVRLIKHIWALVLLLAPTACSCDRGRTLPAEPVTITFDYPDAEAVYYEELIAEFNQIYPQVTIVDVEDYRDDEDEPNPDVFFTSPFELSDQLEEEAILSLAPLIQQDETFVLSDYYPGTVEQFTWEGKLWAIPSGVSVMVLYYNKDLFDRSGVPYPGPGWTWDDFLDAAQAIRDPMDDIYGYGGIDEYFDPLIFVYLHGGSITDSMQNPTRMTYDDPQTIEALEWYAALLHDYNVAPQRPQFEEIGGNVMAGVYGSRVGMWIDWIDERGGSSDSGDDWPALWKMRWGMAALPRAEQAVVPMVTIGYVISSDTAHPEACWEWIAFMQDQTRVPFDMIPARKSLAESDEYREQVGGDVVNTAQASLENALPLSPALFEFINFDVYGRAINSILTGSSTVEEALTQAQRRSEDGD
jgi:ABC-type glycerol-3-phosphate transport system substrate-binding protein